MKTEFGLTGSVRESVEPKTKIPAILCSSQTYNNPHPPLRLTSALCISIAGSSHFATQERSAARADSEGDDDDDIKAQEDQELLDALAESKENNQGW